MFGLYINCSKYPFIDQILDRAKLYETRSRDVLRRLVGERVYLIETGNGQPMVKGYATVRYPDRVWYHEIDRRKDAKIYGTSFDIAPGCNKFFYPLLDVERCEPFPVPENHVNHGRSYTEF